MIGLLLLESGCLSIVALIRIIFPQLLGSTISFKSFSYICPANVYKIYMNKQPKRRPEMALEKQRGESPSTCQSSLCRRLR